MAKFSKEYFTNAIKVISRLRHHVIKESKQRNNQRHIPVVVKERKDSKEIKVEIASKVTLNWDLVVDNNGMQPPKKYPRYSF